MKRLNKLKNDRKNKYVFLLIITFAVLISILTGKTYAKYSQEDEVNFINSRVRWPKASEISYTITANKSIENVEQALNDLYEKLGD